MNTNPGQIERTLALFGNGNNKINVEFIILFYFSSYYYYDSLLWWILFYLTTINYYNDFSYSNYCNYLKKFPITNLYSKNLYSFDVFQIYQT